MVVEEMTERECRAMLSGAYVAHLACAWNNQPYITPIRVDLDGEFLYGYATLGQKIEWMRQNPLVCLEIDEVITNWQWASVIVIGDYEELPHTPEYEDERAIAERLFASHSLWWEPAAVALAGHEQRTRIVFRIRIRCVTGRRATPDTVRAHHVKGNVSETKRQRWLARVRRRVAEYLSRQRKLLEGSS